LDKIKLVRSLLIIGKKVKTKKKVIEMDFLVQQKSFFGTAVDIEITSRQNVDKLRENVNKMTENVDKMTENVDKMTENVDKTTENVD
jgi:hypothetical protein